MYDKIYAKAGDELLDPGGFKAAMQKLALVENLLAIQGKGDERLMNALEQDGVLDGLRQTMSEAVCQYFRIVSKADAAINEKHKAEKEG
ncbi:MAG: hypothetical protein ACLFRO_05070 [Desulfobacterales bacterium]